MAKHEAGIATILRKSGLRSSVQIVAYRSSFTRNSPYPRHFFAPRWQFDRSRSIGVRRDVEIRHITQHNRSPRSRLAACGLAGALGLIFATPVVGETASPSQGSVSVEGNRRVDAGTVRAYFHPAPDGHFDDAARDAALK